MGSDASVVPATNPGARVDTITLVSTVCGGTAPVPTSAVSRKVHGAAGPFDIALPLVGVGGAVGIECRTNATPGTHQLVVTFPGPVTVGSVAVTTGTGNATFSVAGSVVTVDLTGVTDAQRLGLTLSNVNDGSNLGSVLVPMGMLAGDATGNGTVTASDIDQVKGQSGQAVTATNFRTDVTASGGTINSSDIGLVKSRSGTQLPP